MGSDAEECKWFSALYGFLAEFERFYEAEFKKYNPNQPRAPRGSSDGGQWVSVGGSGGSGSAARRREQELGKPKPNTKPKPKPVADLELVNRTPKIDNRVSDNGTQIVESGEIVSDGVIQNVIINKIPERKPRNERHVPTVGEPIFVPDKNGNVPNKVNIFIGGAGDGTSHNVAKSGSLHYDIYGENYYYEQDQEDDINELIKKFPSDIEINLIGHSWGGDTGADVVIDNPKRINKFVTVDPVSTFSGHPDFDDLKENVNLWIDIQAAGVPGKRPSIGDDLAGNGAWKDSPKDHAHIFIQAPFRHEDFDSMIRHKPVYNDINDLIDDSVNKYSIEQILNGKK